MNLKFLILTFFISIPTVKASVTKCVAHRGVHHKFIENGMESIKEAVRIKAPVVEFDVTHTFDGIPILMHDDTLKRTAIHRPGRQCNLSTPIQEQLWIDIKENCLLKGEEEIPLLEDVLEYLSHEPIMAFIELKDRPSILTYQILEAHFTHSLEKVRLISFKEELLNGVRLMGRLHPFHHEVGMLHVYPLFISRKSGYGVNILYNFLSFKFLKKIRKVVETGTWTVNKKKSMKKIIKANVTYLTTNEPELCLQLVKEK